MDFSQWFHLISVLYDLPLGEGGSAQAETDEGYTVLYLFAAFLLCKNPLPPSSVSLRLTAPPQGEALGLCIFQAFPWGKVARRAG